MIGKRISHYRIQEKLGQGGMGVVYKARDTKLERNVALKFLPPELKLDDEAKRRFIQEARAASALSHPNISTIYEIGETDEGTFIAMEYAEGESLGHRILSGPLDLEEAVSVAIQICEGLQEAHEKGIVHRDVKSENIILTAKGKAKIVDFGVAKLMSSAEHSEIGQRTGTVAYMSPEQLQGKEVDLRTDVWSVGALFYEMITGRLPFKGEYEEAQVYSILQTDPAPVSTFREGVPDLADQIVRRALEKDRNNRYQNIHSLLMDLRTLSQTLAYKSGSVPSVIVLPFEDISPGKDNEYFSEGLTEELIMNLSHLGNMRVVSRTTSMQYKGTTKDVKTIGKELNVRYVLEGSVRKFREEFLITAQLIDVAADTHLWAGKYKGQLAEVFNIQEQVARQIVDALALKLSPSEKSVLSRRSTKNAEAFEYYLRARNILYKMTKNDVKSSIQLFLRVIELDDHYAAAYAGLGEAYAFLYLYFELKQIYLDEAVDACLKALMYDPTLAEAYAALGMAYFDKSMLKEALTSVNKAIQLDPNSFIAYWILGRLYHQTDRDREAIEPYNKVVALNPDFYAVHMDLRTVYERLGETERYAETVKNELQVYPRHLARYPEDARAHIFYAVALARSAKLEEGKAEAAKAIELNPSDPLMLYNTACFYARIGEKRLALDTLKNAILAGVENYEWIKRDPDLDCIRGEPEYEKMILGR